MLTHIPLGPFADGAYGVGYQTPGCTSHTVVATGMTATRAIEEAEHLNQEQEQHAIGVERDYEHRNRVLGLAPAVDYLSGWTPKAFAGQSDPTQV